MKHFNKYLLVLLTLSISTVNSMEKQKEDGKGQALEQSSEVFQPFSLKAQCALKILGLIKLGNINLESVLPEEMSEYVKYFQSADIYTDITKIEFVNKWPESEYFDRNGECFQKLLDLATKARLLMYKLLDSESEHIGTFFKILLPDIANRAKNKYKLLMSDYEKNSDITLESLDKECYEDLFLDLEYLIMLLNSILSEKQEADKDKRLLAFTVENYIGDNDLLLRLLVDLNLLSRERMIEYYKEIGKTNQFNVCALKFLSETIQFTKEEFENLLIQTNLLMELIDLPKHNFALDTLKYLFELMENIGIDIKLIIYEKSTYSFSDCYFGYTCYGRIFLRGTLLNKAILAGNLQAIEFLLSKVNQNIKAIEINHAISFAFIGLSSFDNLIKSDVIPTDEETSRKYFIKLNCVIEFLKLKLQNCELKKNV